MFHIVIENYEKEYHALSVDTGEVASPYDKPLILEVQVISHFQSKHSKAENTALIPEHLFPIRIIKPFSGPIAVSIQMAGKLSITRVVYTMPKFWNSDPDKKNVPI